MRGVSLRRELDASNFPRPVKFLVAKPALAVPDLNNAAYLNKKKE